MELRSFTIMDNFIFHNKTNVFNVFFCKPYEINIMLISLLHSSTHLVIRCLTSKPQVLAFIQCEIFATNLCIGLNSAQWICYQTPQKEANVYVGAQFSWKTSGKSKSITCTIVSILYVPSMFAHFKVKHPNVVFIMRHF